MRIALVDNGSLAAAAHRNLRAVAADLTARTGHSVAAVSWKHSHRIPAAELDGFAGDTLAPWVRTQVAAGEREFLFIPFFISAEGAIAGALRRNLETLASELGGFSFKFTPGLSQNCPERNAGAFRYPTKGRAGLPGPPGRLDGNATNESPASPAGPAVPLYPRPLSLIVADRIRTTLAAQNLHRPAVIVVDHGGPSVASANLRNAVADEVRTLLGPAIGPLAAASMESPDGPDFAFNRPLLADQLVVPGWDRGDIVIAPLFLSPGRHAGPEGDLARITQGAQKQQSGLRCHFTALVGTHPLAAETLACHLKSLIL